MKAESRPRLMLWSVPRSRSTAFFRMMTERGDFTVVHEPFSYLVMHGRAEVDGTWAESESELIRTLLKLPGPAFVKDTTGDRYPEVLAAPEFLHGWTHTFLIRDPRETIRSYLRLEPRTRGESFGFDFLHELYTAVEETTGVPPVVVDAADLMGNPEGTVRAYCAATGIPFVPEALSWEPVHRPEWQPSRRWHESVAVSTGLGAMPADPGTPADRVPARYLDRHLPHYETLHARRLTPG